MTGFNVACGGATRLFRINALVEGALRSYILGGLSWRIIQISVTSVYRTAQFQRMLRSSHCLTGIIGELLSLNGIFCFEYIISLWSSEVGPHRGSQLELLIVLNAKLTIG